MPEIEEAFEPLYCKIAWNVKKGISSFITFVRLSRKRDGNGFSRRRRPNLRVAGRADVAGVSAFRIAVQHEPLDDWGDVCALVIRDFCLHAKIAPAFPVIAEDLLEAFLPVG